MRFFLIIIAISSCITILAFIPRSEPEGMECVQPTIDFIKKHAALFAESTIKLQTEINKIKENDSLSISNAKKALKECREQYKSIEFFLTYFFRSNSLVYNEPPNYEVEEPFHEYRSPTGFQVIEAILYSSDPIGQKAELWQQSALVNSSASDVYALLYNLKINDRQILESIRLGLIRLTTLGITGYDAPKLKTGISESSDVLSAFKIILQPFFTGRSDEADSVSLYLDAALKMIQRSSDFNSFNRLSFLTEAIFPFQHHLNLFIEKKGLQLNTTGVLNYDAKNLFSTNALYIDPKSNPNNTPIFPTDTNAIIKAIDSQTDPALIQLGQKLFFEKALSGNATRSCASCHQPDNYFTDLLPKASTLNGDSVVQRNTPTLFYVSYQYSQFWDGRAKSLESQIRAVLNNPIEMNADEKIIVQRLQNSKQYVAAFSKAFPKDEKGSVITVNHLALSIAAFLKTLSPFNSLFDQYMQGNKKALSQQQINGFNLFMGKAQCGTCHFAPIFNGLLPPFYDMTELEVLGTTSDTSFTHPALDADSGRFAATPAIYYMRAFKTPTLRNIAKTAPYMHNGAFPTLESVLEFYNRGGGGGLGLNVPTQTLSPKPLNLSESEIQDIIAFLHSLTDIYTLHPRN